MYPYIAWAYVGHYYADQVSTIVSIVSINMINTLQTSGPALSQKHLELIEIK